MRTSLRVLAIASVAAVPAIPALAVNPTTTPETKPAHPCKPAPHAGVAYILRGVVQRDVSTDKAMTIKVTGGNRWGLWAVMNADPAIENRMVTADIGGDCTRIHKVVVRKRVVRRRVVVHHRVVVRKKVIVRRGLRPEGWHQLDHTDRVLIKWRAPRKTALQDLGPAWRVVELARR